MELFQIVNNRAVPSTHALLIEPFKSIWYNDDTEDKKEATKVFSYVELLCNPRKSNPFSGYSEQERPSKVKRLVFGEDNPELLDSMISEIIECTMKYKELLQISSPSYGLYEDAALAIEKLRAFFREFNFDERTRSGGMVLKPKDVSDAITKVDIVAKNLQKTRDQLQMELIDETRTRNKREIGEFER